MKIKTLVFIALIFCIVPQTFSEEISVVLNSSSDSFFIGESFDLELNLLNIPSDKKCGGFETRISYDKTQLQLSSITLSKDLNSDIGDVSLSNGRISIVWFSTPPTGDINIAKIKFNVLKEGNSTIELLGTTVSDSNGFTYNNMTLSNLKVKLSPLGYTVTEIDLINYETNKKINSKISIKGVKTPLKNISGNIYFENISIMDNPVPNILCSKFNYEVRDNNLSFFMIPNSIYENETFINLLTLPITVKNDDYRITPKVYVNDILLDNFSVNEKKQDENQDTFDGFMFYVDGKYTEKMDTTIGNSKTIRLRANNFKENLTDISGYIFINDSIFEILDYKIPEVSEVYSKLNRSKSNNPNIYVNESYLYFNISLKEQTTTNTFSLLEFRVTPKTNENTSSKVHVGNITVYSNETEILPKFKELTISVIERRKNIPPVTRIYYTIHNNNEVNFQAISHDEDDDLDSLKYYWEFGNGKNSTREKSSQKYPDYSMYLVSCKVTDPLNASYTAKGIIEILNINPITYEVSNRSFKTLKSGENETIVLNMSLTNPFTYPVSVYIEFTGTGSPNSPRYNIELNSQENKTVNLKLDVSKTTEIKWNVRYYPPVSLGNKDIAIGYYQWDFTEKIEFIDPPKIINSTEIVDIEGSNILLKVNKVKKVENQVIEQSFSDSGFSIIYYCFASILGVFTGLTFVNSKIK
ncbi:cellulosome anchoring protein cohesin region [Methanococcus vannielii SB]|uniref:Cellulosome anchoring protein cohesin region n=1 Tax=Methanococcus vannielii (strain ATCC 35089 / DSM 1224 / JCM 13029 / OCM 148 / SB) TaxID=406327 RepID=A6UNH1_METVS|nr:cohesin domain-containing protein [Methanococcus vannielii]ABR54043.1 cellulosome anchoring protein cohesin region [Methanococcus vannielii SB]